MSVFKKSKENLIKSAYKLGYEIGYYKHFDTYGWIGKEKDAIFSDGVRLNIKELIDEEYRKGVKDGEIRRGIDISRGLYGKYEFKPQRFERAQELVWHFSELEHERKRKVIDIPKKIISSGSFMPKKVKLPKKIKELE